MKSPTGIRGIDEITFGGLPKGRPTLVCGPAGSGKTLLAMEFLVQGAAQYGEPGVFMTFEETEEELTKNVASLGFDLAELSEEHKLLLDYIRVERSEIEETGEYDLEGLFIRLSQSIDLIGAKRVVLDSIESLFSGLSNDAILRSELRRLFSWLKAKGVTAIITAEKGQGSLTRYGLEEYISDCVIALDHRVNNQLSTRRLRVVKYRGSLHGTNEYPFIIDKHGISVLPITSIGLAYPVSSERVSTGIPRLDNMLGGKGFYRGSSILVSGTAGTGKTTISASFAHSLCSKGEKCLFFAFEESPSQIVRNMLSVGIDLEPHIREGLLQIPAVRSTLYGLETHLVSMQNLIEDFQPSAVIVDPITNLMTIGDESDTRSMLTRLIDFVKLKRITSVFTNLTYVQRLERTNAGISSVMDTWILLRDIEIGGERNRGIYILKSRGMRHSNQIREFLITDKGVDIVDVYLGPSGVLTGTARATQEAVDKAQEVAEMDGLDHMKAEAGRKKMVLEAQILALQAELKGEEEKMQQNVAKVRKHEREVAENRREMARLRKSDDIDGEDNP